MPAEFTPGQNVIGVPGPKGDTGPAGPPGSGGDPGSHDHDSVYSMLGHNHDSVYALIHGHPYASDTHNHSGVYAPVHSHPYASDTHNHDAAYAALGHNHNSVYALIHGHPYASDTHDHAGVYAPVHSHPYDDAGTAAAAVSTHAGLADPHTGYRLESADHSHASTGLQGGTIAHSALTGLTTGDPHTQYLLESDANWVDLTDGGSTTLHSHAGGGGGAPTGVDYLVGTADATLTNEIVVGTTPGGELGGTWASPTVDSTHSGSSHAGVVSTHEAASDPHTGYQKESEKGVASGYASLDSGILVPIAQLPVGTGAAQVAAGNHTHAGGSDDVVYKAAGADTAINSTTDVTIVTTGVSTAVGDKLLVEAWFTILQNSGATRVFNISLDFDGAFPSEFITGALAASATLLHPMRLKAVLDIRSASLTYAMAEIFGNPAAGIADDANMTMGTTGLWARTWGTQTSDMSGTTTVAFMIRSANATATQTLRLHTFTIRKFTP